LLYTTKSDNQPETYTFKESFAIRGFGRKYVLHVDCTWKTY
jgi:hypothetical protein